jgi:hypothetical protein
MEKTVYIKEESYVLKQVTEKLIPDFLELFNKNRQKNYTLQHFIAKFTTSPATGMYYGFMLYKDNLAVAHTGAIPFYANNKSEKVLIANLTDSVTHIDFQRKGLNSFLLNYLIDYCKNQKVDFIYRLSKPLTTFLSIEKYGFINDFEMKEIIIETDCLPVYRAITKFWKVELFIKYFNLVTSIFYTKTIDLETLNKEKIQIFRNKEFLHHKSFEKNWLVKLNNISILFKLDFGILIGDTSAKNIDDIKFIISKLKVLCFWTGLNNIRIRISENHPLFNEYKELGTVKPSNPIMIKNLQNNEYYKELILTSIDANTF